MKEVKMRMGRREESGGCLGSSMQMAWLCVGSPRKTKGQCFVDVCRKSVLKVNTDKSKVIILGGEEGLECEVCVDGMSLNHVGI